MLVYPGVRFRSLLVFSLSFTNMLEKFPFGEEHFSDTSFTFLPYVPYFVSIFESYGACKTSFVSPNLKE